MTWKQSGKTHNEEGFRLPDGFMRRVEQFGLRVNDLRSGQPCRDCGDLEFVAWQLSEADRVGFVAELSRVALPVGGWTVLGAHKLIGSVSGWEVDLPVRWDLFDAALDWMAANGYGPFDLNSYEARRSAVRGHR